MAWETRGTKRFYYKSAREGRTVKKIYLGRGEAAQRAAAEDAAARARREAERAELRRVEALLEAPERLTDQLKDQIDVLLAATMYAGGWHYHRGEWRRQRGEKH